MITYVKQSPDAVCVECVGIGNVRLLVTRQGCAVHLLWRAMPSLNDVIPPWQLGSVEEASAVAARIVLAALGECGPSEAPEYIELCGYVAGMFVSSMLGQKALGLAPELVPHWLGSYMEGMGVPSAEHGCAAAGVLMFRLSERDSEKARQRFEAVLKELTRPTSVPMALKYADVDELDIGRDAVLVAQVIARNGVPVHRAVSLWAVHDTDSVVAMRGDASEEPALWLEPDGATWRANARVWGDLATAEAWITFYYTGGSVSWQDAVAEKSP